MFAVTHGRYVARRAEGPGDLAASLALRHLCFRGGRGAGDADAHDGDCQHVLVMHGDKLVATFRAQVFGKGQSLSNSYAAQFYDLTGLQAHPGPLIELGRFCLHPDHSDPNILRMAWASLTRMVDEADARMLFGCTSFAGADPVRHRAAFAHLARHHIGPETFRPGPRAANRVDLAGQAASQGSPALPPLLRTYLAMGGWVSDHAVLDDDLDTAHVFTALDIAGIPPARARALRSLAM